jgi:hypothetical protein
MFADERVNKLIKDLDKRRKAASKKAAADFPASLRGEEHVR